MRPILSTSRLLLRPWRDEDLAPFTEMNADERVMEFFPAPLTAAASKAFFERIRQEWVREESGLYALEKREDGTLIGFTGLHRIAFAGELHGKTEIGWRLRAEAWGQGYATEAARATLACAEETGIGEVVAFTAIRNLRSQQVMKRLGMEYAGEFAHPALPEEHPLSRHVLYRIRLK